tara:strand:- start:4005 stop:5066 length:1062 start_codon:yes stop_codon:yes gene_type:complete
MSSKILYIDSRDADSYLATKIENDTSFDLTSYFQYILKENIEVPLHQRALISLNSATIPYSFYNIRLGINDVLSAKATNTNSGLSLELEHTIPAGNYTALTLADNIKSFMNNTLQKSGHNITYVFEMLFDSDRQKYIYSATTTEAHPIQIEFLFQDEDLLSPHIEMGFPAVDVSFTTSSDDLLSTNVIDINGSIHGVYIRTNLVSTGTLDSQSKTFSNILARIPINVQSGGIIFAVPSNQTHKTLVDIRSINTLTIRLTDERNRILDLNGLHFQLSVLVDFINAEKPIVRDEGGLSEAGGGSYAVQSDLSGTEKINLAQENQVLREQVENLEKNRRKVGRPRNVGRPKKNKQN